MGREAVQALSEDKRFSVAALLIRSTPSPASPAPIYERAEDLLREVRPDVWLDLTDARSVQHHVDLALAAGVRPVVGATGYGMDDISRWQDACLESGMGGVAAPNFAVGALLMTRFAEEAGRFFAQAEIVELHHAGKRDAPSGTARRTAQAIAAVRKGLRETGAAELTDVEAAARIGQAAAARTSSERAEPSVPPAASPARGLLVDGIPVHSVRLPGLVAHQEVLFGGDGELLTIRHDSLSRASFMPGIQFACAKVCELRQFVYGLEHLLW